jgi:spore germination cell wall hydrolase CwlJ-like protein
MTRIVRAAGIAAAALALAASASSATSQGDSAVNSRFTAYAVQHLERSEGQEERSFLGRIVDHVVAAFTPAAEAAPAPRRLTLDELVAEHRGVSTADAEEECLARAVYFEARGEPIEGQLAVAEVVLNRAASGKYPTTICAVVTQPWQFSFIQRGRFPNPDKDSAAWEKSVAIARIAGGKLADRLAENVLWYHADYVAPSWGKRLDKQAKIGLHIFYS